MFFIIYIYNAFHFHFLSFWIRDLIHLCEQSCLACLFRSNKAWPLNSIFYGGKMPHKQILNHFLSNRAVKLSSRMGDGSTWLCERCGICCFIFIILFLAKQCNLISMLYIGYKYFTVAKKCYFQGPFPFPSHLNVKVYFWHQHCLLSPSAPQTCGSCSGEITLRQNCRSQGRCGTSQTWHGACHVADTEDHLTRSIHFAPRYGLRRLTAQVYQVHSWILVSQSLLVKRQALNFKCRQYRFDKRPI